MQRTILAGKSDRRIKGVKDTLAKCFKVKDMGELHYSLILVLQLHKIRSMEKPGLDTATSPQTYLQNWSGKL